MYSTQVDGHIHTHIHTKKHNVVQLWTIRDNDKSAWSDKEGDKYTRHRVFISHMSIFIA